MVMFFTLFLELNQIRYINMYDALLKKLKNKIHIFLIYLLMFSLNPLFKIINVTLTIIFLITFLLSKLNDKLKCKLG
jgi:hypothetical protein